MVRQGVSHVVDFGPGHTVGAGRLTAEQTEGTGVKASCAFTHPLPVTLLLQVILAGSFAGTRTMSSKRMLFEPQYARAHSSVLTQ